MPPKFLYYPVRQPINPTNPFGEPGAIYTALSQKGHPGVDFEAPSGTKVYAPCDGGAFYVTDFKALVEEGLIPADALPAAAGCGLWIRTPNNAHPEANIILWHMYPENTPEFPYGIPTGPNVVTQVKAGDFLGYSDNSGYPIETNGSHVHFGYIPCDETGAALNPDNGYKGCVDPTPYFNGEFAEDISIKQAVVEKTAQVVALVTQASDAQVSHQEKLSVLQEIENFLTSL